MTENSKNIGSENNKNQELQTSISNQQFTALARRIEGISNAYTGLKSAQTNNDNKFDAVADKLRESAKEITTLQTDYRALQNDRTNVVTQVTRIRSDLDNIKKKSNILTQNYETMNIDMSNVKDIQRQLQQTKSTLATISKNSADARSIQIAAEQIRAEQMGFKSKISEEINDLKKDVIIVQKKVGTINSGLQDQVDDLKADLAKVDEEIQKEYVSLNNKYSQY